VKQLDVDLQLVSTSLKSLELSEQTVRLSLTSLTTGCIL